MIVHIVMWKLKEEAEGGTKAENALKIKEVLEPLINKIGGIEKIQVGINFNKLEGAFDVVLNSEFTTVEALNQYQNHPEHLKAAGFVRKVFEKRVVVDYER